MKAILTGLATLLLITAPVKAQAQWWINSKPPLNRQGQPMPSSWWEAAKQGSLKHGSNPFLIAAVADIESNGWKAGRLGRSKYQAPMGFNRKCRIPDHIMFIPEEQIKWACYLLKNPGHLKKYNPEYHKNGYLKSVSSLKRKMESQAEKEIKNDPRRFQQTGFNYLSSLGDHLK